MLKSGLVYYRHAGCYNHLSFEEAQKIANYTANIKLFYHWGLRAITLIQQPR